MCLFVAFAIDAVGSPNGGALPLAGSAAAADGILGGGTVGGGAPGVFLTGMGLGAEVLGDEAVGMVGRRRCRLNTSG